MFSLMRRVLFVAVAASLVSFGTGCGGSDDEEAQPKSQSPGDPRIKGPASMGGGPGEAKTNTIE